MECCLCNEIYDENQYKPYSINPCGHHFCLKCINNLKSKSCPYCRGVIKSKTLNRGILDMMKSKEKLLTDEPNRKRIKLLKSSLVEEVENLLTDWKLKKDNLLLQFKNEIRSFKETVTLDKLTKVKKIEVDSEKILNILNQTENVYNRDARLEIENYAKNIQKRIELINESTESKEALENADNLKEEIVLHLANIKKGDVFFPHLVYSNNLNGEYAIGNLLKREKTGKLIPIKSEFEIIPVIESRSEATFQLELNNFSKFKESFETRSSSIPCIVGDLGWKIQAISLWDKDEDFVLGFFVQCANERNSPNRSISATVELKLLNLKNKEQSKVIKLICLFDEKQNSWGYSPFISMNEIINPINDFYDPKNDLVFLEVGINLNSSI